MVDSALLAQLKRRPRRPNEASYFFHDVGFNTEAVKILPGEFFVFDQDIALTTLLGSCVAACLFDRGAGLGGMNHFLLPDGGDSSARYGVNAMEILINELLKGGARRGGLEAKIFGGAAVIQNMISINVGDQNVRFVESYLAAEQIPVTSRDVRGEFPRRVCLFPRSGRALVKRLQIQSGPALAAQEASYLHQLASAQGRGGSVEMF